MPADFHNLKADAITSCLRTSRDTLSVWRIANTAELENGIMAIVGTLERIQGFHYLVLDEKDILALGFEIKDSAGGSFVTSLNNRHADIVDLTYERIGLVADEMRKKISQGQYEGITESKVRKRINDAIKTGAINADDLPEKVRKDL